MNKLNKFTNQELFHTLLRIAYKEGNLEKIKKLVKDGADIHYEKPGYWTPIQSASANGYLDIVKWLYEQGADPTTDNNFAIRLASERGHLEVVKYLYSIGCDPTVYDNCAIYLMIILLKYFYVKIINFNKMFVQNLKYLGVLSQIFGMEV